MALSSHLRGPPPSQPDDDPRITNTHGCVCRHYRHRYPHVISSYVKLVSRSAWICVRSAGSFRSVSVCDELPVDDVGEVAFERSGGFATAAAFAAAAADVGACTRIHSGLGERHHVDRGVDPTVAGAVEPVPLSLAGGGGDGCGAVERGEVAAGGDAADVADLAEDPGGDQLADADEGEQAACEFAHASADLAL